MRIAALAGLPVLALLGCAGASPRPPAPEAGTGEVAQDVAEVGGTRFDVFTYRPAGCALTGILIVFHGVDRNAGPYRNDAIPLGQRFCKFVVAPLFDAARFPSWRYQRGGVVHGGVQPAARWTVSLVPGFADWARARLGRPDLPYALIGHSAGAQFLSRVAAYAPGQATAFVIMNPSTWVEPRLDVPAPYGFGGLYPPGEDAAALRRYLALPVTVALGGEDVGSKNLAESDEAEEQGGTRFARGQNVFHAAEEAARQRGWTFNWRLAIVPGVGHNARQMMASAPVSDALGPR